MSTARATGRGPVTTDADYRKSPGSGLAPATASGYKTCPRADPPPQTADRLQGETRSYNEARERGRCVRQPKRRQAVPAALSTREGIRLWWWLSGGDGSDQRGAMSVIRGRRSGDGHTEEFCSSSATERYTAV